MSLTQATLNATKPEEIIPEKETLKSKSELFTKFMTSDAKFKNQVTKANSVNSSRISTTESAMLRKHFGQS